MKKTIFFAVILTCIVGSAQAQKSSLAPWELRFDTITTDENMAKILFFADKELVLTKNNKPWEIVPKKKGKVDVKDIRIHIDTHRKGIFAEHDTVIKSYQATNGTQQSYPSRRIWITFKVKDTKEEISIPFYLATDGKSFFFVNEVSFYVLGTDLKNPDAIKKADFFTIAGSAKIAVDASFLEQMRQTEDMKIR